MELADLKKKYDTLVLDYELHNSKYFGDQEKEYLQFEFLKKIHNLRMEYYGNIFSAFLPENLHEKGTD
jgi:hypothetical protein